MPFDYAEYQQKCNALSTEQLQKEWENYTRQIAGASTSTATSVLFSPLTAGVSLVGLGLSAPRIHNARKKREIIEAGLKARGTTHNTRGRDVAGSMAVSGVIAGLTLGLATPGADLIAGEAAGKGAEYVASHVILEGAGAAVEHKHTNHAKKKGEDKLKMQQMQMQLNQYQGYQQQYVQGQGMQMQSIQNVQMQMGGFQQPGLTNGMQLAQPGILMQNQNQIQQQNQPGLQIPGMNQPQMQIPGLQPGMMLPQRPHSAAPNNQYAPPPSGIGAAQHQSQYQQFVQNTPPQGQLPQYQQVPLPEKYLVTVPNSHNQNFQGQQQAQGYPPEKSPAYTTNGPLQGDMTPLPLYSQQPPAQLAETDISNPQDHPNHANHPTHIDIPEGPTMEEEIAFLKARLLQMELEKRGISATISSPCEISLDGPEPEKSAEKQPSVVVQEIIPPAQENTQPQQQPQLHIETQAAVQPQNPPEPQRRNTLSTPPMPDGRTSSPGIPQQSQYVPGPSASPHPQQYQAPPVQQNYGPPAPQNPPVQQYSQAAATPVNQNQQYTSPPPPPAQAAPVQHQYSQPPATPVNQNHKYNPAPAPPVAQNQTQYQNPLQTNYAPLTPQPQYQSPPVQTAPIYQPQPMPAQPTNQIQYAPTQQNYQKPPEPIQRQDSGYYSQAPTPLQRTSSVISSVSSISSPLNRHNSIASASYPQQPQGQQVPYNPQQQQQGGYNPQIHGRTPSIVSPMSTPAPPPYFSPPPTGPQPILAGKGPDYFNQGNAPGTHPSFPNYAQAGIGGQRGSVVGGVQGWQWGAPNQQQQQGMPMQGMPMQQGVGMVGGGTQGGEPNYGAPPPIPGVWRSS